MKFMWMMIFMVLPILAMVYIAWHVWVLLPWPAVWKGVAIAVGVASFLLLFMSVTRQFEGLPLPVSQVLYETGTSRL